jgi:hypothetical protein
VSYGQPIQGSATRVFNADYYISKDWTLSGQTGASEDSHLDFLFRYPLNTPPAAKPTRPPSIAGAQGLSAMIRSE